MTVDGELTGWLGLCFAESAKIIIIEYSQKAVNEFINTRQRVYRHSAWSLTLKVFQSVSAG